MNELSWHPLWLLHWFLLDSSLDLKVDEKNEKSDVHELECHRTMNEIRSKVPRSCLCPADYLILILFKLCEIVKFLDSLLLRRYCFFNNSAFHSNNAFYVLNVGDKKP
jgi:hypothetical protein